MPPVVRIHQHGGPEVLKLEDIGLPPPGPGQVTIDRTFAFDDIVEAHRRLESNAQLGKIVVTD